MTLVHEITRDGRDAYHRAGIRCDGCGAESPRLFVDGSEFDIQVAVLRLQAQHGFVERIEGRYLRTYCRPCAAPAELRVLGQLELFAEAVP